MTPSPGRGLRERRQRGLRALHLEPRALHEPVDEARDRGREGEAARLSVGCQQVQEEQELLLDGNLARLVVDEVDALAGRVEDDAEVGSDRRHEPLRLPEGLGEPAAPGRSAAR